MKPALLLIDLQQDFLSRPGLLPECEILVTAVADLLGVARARAIPVFHVHTQVAADGRDCMPHWANRDPIPCRAGTPGGTPPPALEPVSGEAVVRKRFYNAFEGQELEQRLRAARVDTLVLAGVYLNACIQATALEGYARGFRILIAEEAVGSTDILHAECTRRWLEQRVARFVPHRTLRQQLVGAESPATTELEVGWVDGVWRHAGPSVDILEHASPLDSSDVVTRMGEADPDVVEAAMSAARRYCRERPGHAPLLRGLRAWGDAIEARRDDLVRGMARELGKPVADGHEEVTRAVAHLRWSVQLAEETEPGWPGGRVRRHPRGVVGLLTPWNNPVAIPLAKISAALAFGNAVVWKPSPLAMDTTRRVIQCYAEAGLPCGALQLLAGGARTGRELVAHTGVDAVSVTGSEATGRWVRALCARGGTPLQAELGGNNAVIVDRHADVDHLAAPLARAAFSFAGQRCTAIRRIIVARPVAHALEAALKTAVEALPSGDPLDPSTVLGPLVSSAHRDAIEAEVAEAIAAGARLVCGGQRPDAAGPGAWLRPALLADARPDSPIVQRESFGPIAMLLVADDLGHAITLANGVPQGLVAGLLGSDAAGRRRFAEQVEAGILRFDDGPLSPHPGAPFGGWKASHLGPPEHGIWDREFYTRPQAVYGGDIE